jgi:HEAT repeat protein
MDAAVALYAVHDPAVVPALVKALDDPEALVRHHGVSNSSDDPQHMVCRVMSGGAVRREEGKSDILAAVAGRAVLEL